MGPAGAFLIACKSSRVDVLLTRETGKNTKLARLLDARHISWFEMPLIESAPGTDRDRLAVVLTEQTFDWVTITSPEAAAVFLRGWREARRPSVKVAVVGKASGHILEAEGAPELLQIAFTPSKANAEHLSAELPLKAQGKSSVLYPASAKAGKDLESGLMARGCSVQRLDTYDTIPVKSLSSETLEAAAAAQVLAIASPSAIKAWVAITGGTEDLAIACIGATSAQAAVKLGFSDVFFPDSPGLEGFVTSIEDALQSRKAVSR